MFINLMVQSKRDSIPRTIVNENSKYNCVSIYGDITDLKTKIIPCYLTNDEIDELEAGSGNISFNNSILFRIIKSCCYHNGQHIDHCMNLLRFTKNNRIKVDDLIDSKECADVLLDFLNYVDNGRDSDSYDTLNLMDTINRKWYPDIDESDDEN